MSAADHEKSSAPQAWPVLASKQWIDDQRSMFADGLAISEARGAFILLIVCARLAGGGRLL